MSYFKTTVLDVKGYNKADLHPAFRFIQEFGILNLGKDEDFTLETGSKEYGFIVLKGACEIEVDGKKYGSIVSREDFFSGLPTALYVPADSRCYISNGRAQIAICAGRCDKKTETALITPEQVKVMEVGKGNWSRNVRIIIGPDTPSVNIIIGETLNPPGNWSGIPPAKHENNNQPLESLHEELYYFKTDKPQGWGIERIYSPERNINELVYLEDSTVTFMPWGYHEIVAAPGYTLYYLFFLAGEGNKLAQFEDPDHVWIKNP